MTTLAAVIAITVAVAAVGAALRPVLVGGARTAPGAIATVPLGQRRWRGTRHAPPSEVAMAEWCEHVARNVRAGSSLRRAMEDAGGAVPHAAPIFGPVLGALDRGRGLRQALAELDDDPSTATGLVVGVLGACSDLGGPAAAPLDRTAAILHARAAEREERLTASAQARLSARVLTVLPVGTLALLSAAEPRTRAALGTPAGATCLVLGGLANVVGWWWMRRVIERST